MEQAITIAILVTGAVLAALSASAGMAGAVQLTERQSHGYMHVIFYAMLLMVAMSNLLSGRDLSVHALSLTEPAVLVRHPLVRLAQPLMSLLLLTIAGERIVTRFLNRGKATPAPPVILVSFIFFWAATVAAPALLGAHPHLSHDYVYPLVIGIAAILITGMERDLALRAARNALLLFMAAGLLLIPLKPSLVLDSSYTQGFLPGVPRLAGLAAHAVSLGVLAQLGLLCLLARPFERAWLTRLAWALGLAVLLLAQSKTAWIAFVVCSLCLLVVRQGPSFWRRVGDPLHPEVGVVSLLVFMAGVSALAVLLMFGELDARLSSFFASAEGAQLASLTGRDQIWAIAYEEWRRNPVFGYGPTLWDASFRASIGMPNATHAHNQFMDTLSRSGTVGATALVLYAVILLVLSLRYARASGGLTLALFVALALRAMSEVPLLLFGYGPELVTHVLLLMTLAAAANEARVARVTKVQAARSRAHAGFSTAKDGLASARARP
ncbi:O-antigen ligase family protein [Polaromonas sp. JS666]|uniref:O-antigen ligase family protein n=1 Tax=Polaromonas sp. (strain JS666 / ATCC BAA-500) TaxID=296591 RepID=UPI000046459B|nr:O-antigen ligase family protein [Polaromonas sp. JS666]ABE43822.1 O-antigen polymerase [Polaromonas sp. JS666]